MGKTGGVALRTLLTITYAIAFLCATLITGVYTYFLTRLATNSLPINREWEAIEGIAGGGFIFTIFAVLLTCFLGGVFFFAVVAILLDLALCGGFIAIAVLARHGASSCSGIVQTPLGTGPAQVSNPLYGKNGFGLGAPRAYAPNLGTACKLNTASFAAAVAGGFFFLVAALLQIAVLRNHRSNKRESSSSADGLISERDKGYFESTEVDGLDIRHGNHATIPPIKRTLRPDSYQNSNVGAANP